MCNFPPDLICLLEGEFPQKEIRWYSTHGGGPSQNLTFDRDMTGAASPFWTLSQSRYTSSPPVTHPAVRSIRTIFRFEAFGASAKQEATTGRMVCEKEKRKKIINTKKKQKPKPWWPGFRANAMQTCHVHVKKNKTKPLLYSNPSRALIHRFVNW